MSTFQTPPPSQQPGPGFGPVQAPYGQPQGVPSQPYPAQSAVPAYGPPQTLAPQTGGPQGPPAQALAVPGMRLLARFLDYLITGALIAGAWVPTTLWMGRTFVPGDSRGVPVVLGLFAWSLLVGLFFEPLTMAMGGTLGKAICGLRVVRVETGRKLGFGQALGRWLAYLGIGMVPVLGLIGVLSCLWNEPFRQCLHDRAAKTVVVKRRWQ
ncbi:RDD family protein [Streptomyces sp. RS10V-4]|uniref:RDD family protein n=1 Tax=Streptomyces rhizoryzae TaxID=2932493 RepID=UPI002003DF60|nr:RDD family protein [Streptomyces rhizoryzae]MCK7622849.1 RDD family protein [Streptomyces rhizoryzae]